MKNIKNDWEANYDADTLMRYQEIISNSKRYNAAKKAAAKKADDYEKSAKFARSASTSKKK